MVFIKVVSQRMAIKIIFSILCCCEYGSHGFVYQNVPSGPFALTNLFSLSNFTSEPQVSKRYGQKYARGRRRFS